MSKIYYVNLIKFTVVRQHIAWLKWYKIKIKKYLLKIFFFTEFNKCNSLFLINVQETFVNPIIVFELNNYFITLFQFTISCSIRSYYILWFKHPLYIIALRKKYQFRQFLSEFSYILGVAAFWIKNFLMMKKLTKTILNS